MRKNIHLDAYYKAVLVQKRVYAKGEGNSDYVEFIIAYPTRNYELFEELRNVKGKRAGKLILKLQSKDYTNEHERRKVKWKLAIKSQHISKVFPLGHNTAKADLIRPNDLLLLVSGKGWGFEGLEQLEIFIAKGKKNDSGFVQMFEGGEFMGEMDLLRNAAEIEEE